MLWVSNCIIILPERARLLLSLTAVAARSGLSINKLVPRDAQDISLPTTPRVVALLWYEEIPSHVNLLAWQCTNLLALGNRISSEFVDFNSRTLAMPSCVSDRLRASSTFALSFQNPTAFFLSPNKAELPSAKNLRVIFFFLVRKREGSQGNEGYIVCNASAREG